MKQTQERQPRIFQDMLEKQESRLMKEKIRTQQEYLDLIREGINRGIQKNSSSRIGDKILVNECEERNEGLGMERKRLLSHPRPRQNMSGVRLSSWITNKLNI